MVNTCPSFHLLADLAEQIAISHPEAKVVYAHEVGPLDHMEAPWTVCSLIAHLNVEAGGCRSCFDTYWDAFGRAKENRYRVHG